MNARKRRQQECLSQEQLAEKTGLSLRTIQRLESGQRVSRSSLKTLADFFGIAVDELQAKPRLSLPEIAGVKAMRSMSQHRAIQLILFVVTFFVCCFQWLAYYAYLNEVASDASLWHILGIVAQIGLAAALLAWIFSLARVTFVWTYYVTAALFIIAAIALGVISRDWQSSPSVALLFPVFYSAMLLAQMLIHVLQLARSLKGETVVLAQHFS
jgi:transcriptional regulator with XRE-family HTH domain